MKCLELLRSKIGDSLRPPIRSLLVGLYADGDRLLEIGPGYQPRVLVGRNSFFVDIDFSALKAVGGNAAVGNVEALPYPSGAFDLVCAFDVLEHVEEDREAFSEISRVLKRSSIFIFSVPLFEKYWSHFDQMVGHMRRYHPSDLEAILEEVGFGVERFLCPRNLWAFLFEHGYAWVMVWLQILLDFALACLPPICRAGLYKFYALTPLNRMRRVDQVPWKERRLSEIENRWSVIIVCRKSANH